ncbi:LANO_0E08108g1_1 [Lachancea nothofagi CBS 11611]|uniref:alcohol O-acetyltransferase n=1 Tax=Lachancea nothofagi CBS 11611 TaxID=1266666 RepID=A0A1G4JUW0_9SACH|nr:LANO_0E08108g1_1 [Lachancea nothofagi CBS 11611]
MHIPLLNPFHWGYHGTVEQVSNPQGTTALKLKNKKDNVELHDFINQEVPGLKDGSKFELHPALFTGYLQTLYLGGADFSKNFPVFYGRETVNFSDGGICTADWVMPTWKIRYALDPKTQKFDLTKFKSDEQATHPDNWPRLHPRTRFLDKQEKVEVQTSEKPLVVVIHGLAGGSHEPIIRSLTQDLSNVANSKFDVVVLNCRGCARSKITTRKLFYALFTSDIRDFINREKSRHPSRKIFAVGFSFGGTMLGNYLGEEGDQAPIEAAAFLCTPWDLYHSALKMNDDWWSRTLFSKSIAQFLTRLVKVNIEELEFKDGDEKPTEPPTMKNPSFCVFTKENLKKAHNFSSTMEFDNTFTAPCLGFSNAIDYYKACGSIHELPNVKVPTLIINSKDDPVVGEDSIPYQYARENKNLTLCVSDLGGHLAYLNKNYESWATTQITEYFSKFEELIQ